MAASLASTRAPPPPLANTTNPRKPTARSSPHISARTWRVPKRNCGPVGRGAVGAKEGPPGPVDVSKLNGYTPLGALSFEKSLTRHTYSVTVAGASAEECFLAWQDRNNHSKFITLAERIGWDGGEDAPDAIYEFFYRWARMPAVQMVCEIERAEVVPGKLIRFRNKGDPETFIPGEEQELPMEGTVEFEQKGSDTIVTLIFGYGMPNIFIDYVGKDAVAFNVEMILEDNLERFKAMVEGKQGSQQQ